MQEIKNKILYFCFNQERGIAFQVTPTPELR